jgi:hypothetical protein
VVGLGAVLLGGGGDDDAERASAPDPSPTAEATPEASATEEQGGGGTAAPEEEQSGGGTGAGAGETVAAGQGSPGGAVRSFYERAAADDFDGAWAVAGDGLRGVWGDSQSAMEADLRSLESIEFPRLDVTSEEGNTATVAIRSVARHTTYTDRCTGTIQATRGPGDKWRMGRPSVSCSKG